MDTPTLVLIILIFYFLYNYSPLGCVLNPVKCIESEAKSIKSFFDDLFGGIKSKL